MAPGEVERLRYRLYIGADSLPRAGENAETMVTPVESAASYPSCSRSNDKRPPLQAVRAPPARTTAEVKQFNICSCISCMRGSSGRCVVRDIPQAAARPYCVTAMTSHRLLLLDALGFSLDDGRGTSRSRRRSPGSDRTRHFIALASTRRITRVSGRRQLHKLLLLPETCLISFHP